jgi:hypothetical protein
VRFHLWAYDIRVGKDNSKCNLPKFEQSDEAQETCTAEYQTSLPGGRLVPDEDCTGTIVQLCGSHGLSVFAGFSSSRQNRQTALVSAFNPKMPAQRLADLKKENSELREEVKRLPRASCTK